MRVWFELVDAAGSMIGLTGDFVDMAPNEIVASLRMEILRLHESTILRGVSTGDILVFANPGAFAKTQPMDVDDTLEPFGKSPRDPVIVQATLRPPTPTTPQLPLPTPAFDSESVLDECGDLDAWTAGSVHRISSICAFMKPLGGCTDNGKIFWREEERQVASLLLRGWLDPDDFNANKRSIAVGSPGVGKSAMLCLLAFHVVLKHKKTVLMLRQQDHEQQELCLIYLSYRGSQAVSFFETDCTSERAISIYNALSQEAGKANVWLFLDGFVFRDITSGLKTFKLLATSQQANLKSQQAEHAYCCLHPCWTKNDLVKMAKSVYGWDLTQAESRFFFSGRSVREFSCPTTLAAVVEMSTTVRMGEDPSSLIANREGIRADTKQVDQLRRTFVQDPTNPIHYLLPTHWVHVVD